MTYGSQDLRIGRGIGQVTPPGLNPKNNTFRGSERAVYLYEEEDEFDELDDFVNDVNAKSRNKLSKKIGMGYKGGIDKSRSDKAYFVGNNAILEYQGNQAMKGMVTNLTYRSPSGKKKGHSMTGRSAAYPMINPGNFKGIGTQYGSSRPHKLLTDIEDDNIFNLGDMLDPMERSFIRQQNKIKKVLNTINEYLFYDKAKQRQ